MNLYIERCDLVRGADGRPSRLSNSYEVRVRREMDARQSFETERSVVIAEKRKKKERKIHRPSWKFRAPKKFSRTSSKDRKSYQDENEQPNRRGSSIARVSKFFGVRDWPLSSPLSAYYRIPIHCSRHTKKNIYDNSSATSDLTIECVLAGVQHDAPDQGIYVCSSLPLEWNEWGAFFPIWTGWKRFSFTLYLYRAVSIYISVV